MGLAGWLVGRRMKISGDGGWLNEARLTGKLAPPNRRDRLKTIAGQFCCICFLRDSLLLNVSLFRNKSDLPVIAADQFSLPHSSEINALLGRATGSAAASRHARR